MSMRRPSNASSSVSATLANERCGGIHLDHRQPPASGRDGITLVRVRLLANPQSVQLCLEGTSINYFGRSKSIAHDVFHRSPLRTPVRLSPQPRAFERLLWGRL